MHSPRTNAQRETQQNFRSSQLERTQALCEAIMPGGLRSQQWQQHPALPPLLLSLRLRFVLCPSQIFRPPSLQSSLSLLLFGQPPFQTLKPLFQQSHGIFHRPDKTLLHSAHGGSQLFQACPHLRPLVRTHGRSLVQVEREPDRVRI